MTESSKTRNKIPLGSKYYIMILDSLSRELNKGEKKQDRFSVIPRHESLTTTVKGYKIENPPDFIVFDSDTSDVYFMDIKGESPSSDIPLGAYDSLLKTAKLYKSSALAPNVVFISASSVPPNIKYELFAEGVSIVESPEIDNLVDEIANTIHELPATLAHEGKYISIAIKELKEVSVVEIVGRMDTATSIDLENVLSEILAHEKKEIVIDLSQVIFIASAGLRWLIQVRKRLQSIGGRLVLVAPSKQATDALFISDLTRLFEQYNDQATAIESFILRNVQSDHSQE